MLPESFNRLRNTAKEDFDQFVDWLFRHALNELRAARGDGAATRAAWVDFFQRGLRADLLLDELMAHVPELFQRVQYPSDEARNVLGMLKQLNLAELGVPARAAGTIQICPEGR